MSKSKKNNEQLKKKIFLSLSREYEKYNTEKYTLLNHKKIVEYLFNKQMNEVRTLKQLLDIKYNDPVKIIRLTDTNRCQIDVTMSTLLGLHNNYAEKYENNKQKNGEKIKYLVTDMTKNEIKIMNYLEKYIEKYDKIAYVYNWNFKIEGEDTSLLKIPSVNYQNNQNYSFYGVTLFHNQLVQFIIIYDEDNENNEEKHIMNIINQYMLLQMNINLLRLNKKTDAKKEINIFINKIKNTTEYVIQNGIVADRKLFRSMEENDILVKFCEDYKYNRKIYYKVSKLTDDNIEDDNDVFYAKQTSKDIHKNKYQDEGFLISNETLKKIINNKSVYETKKDKANEMLIKLIGEDDEDIEDRELIKEIMNENLSGEEDEVELVEEEKNDVKELLKNYKSKKIDFTPYFKSEKLKLYHLLENNNKLLPGETYIKYINVGDAFTNKKYKDHVHTGGILLAGGIFLNGKFKKYENNDEIEPNNWTHLLVRSVPFPTLEEDREVHEYEAHTYHLKINSCYIFYKYFKRK